MYRFVSLSALSVALASANTDAQVVMTRKMPGILTARPLTKMVAQTGPRTVAPCLAKPVLTSGELTAGKAAGIKFAEAGSGNGRGAAIAVVNGEPVYQPNLSAGSAPAPIAPKLTRIYFRYSPVTYSNGAPVPRGRDVPIGWFAGAAVEKQATIVKNYGDGTVDIRLPTADDALFGQQVDLVVVTDRCTITAPMAIRPPTHVGRWYPPYLIESCAGRATNDRFGAALRRETVGYVNGPYAQVCFPFGAVHDGGTDSNARLPGGTDSYIIWDGGFDPNFTVRVASFCSVTHRQELLSPLSAAQIGRPLAAKASSRPWRVTVTWSNDAARKMCIYGLVISGRHPASMPEEQSATNGMMVDMPNEWGDGTKLDKTFGARMPESFQLTLGNSAHLTILSWYAGRNANGSIRHSWPLEF